MSKVGFVLLLVGGVLMILAHETLAMDPITRGSIAWFIDMYVTPYVGIPNLGVSVANFLYVLTSLGGYGVVAGAVIWFAAGQGTLALIGKFIIGMSGFSAISVVMMTIYNAWQIGVFSNPIHIVLLWFAGLGVGFAGVFCSFLGMMIGAGRPVPPSEPQETYPESADQYEVI